MISLSPAAAEYLRSKGGVCRLVLPPRVTACCASVQERPSVELGAPKDPGDFELVETEGVRVHVPRAMARREGIVIVARSFLGFSLLGVEGWEGI